MKIIILLLLSIQVFGQDSVTVTNSIYTSVFDKVIREPIRITYKLYHGGGVCKRTAMAFSNNQKFATANKKDYSHSGYDKGHLAPAEDFAFDCKKELITFQYYNCLPQTPALNRGIWKVWETTIREWSQTDSLLIICGGSDFHLKGKLNVPDTCFKEVYSLSTGKRLFSAKFTNTAHPQMFRKLE